MRIECRTGGSVGITPTLTWAAFFAVVVAPAATACDYDCHEFGHGPECSASPCLALNWVLWTVVVVGAILSNCAKDWGSQQREEQQANRVRDMEMQLVRQEVREECSVTSNPAPTPAAAAAAPVPMPALLAAAPPAAKYLSSVLQENKLGQYEMALRELGVAMASDLPDLDEADLIEIGMKKIEIKRLQRV